jgi:hypothetical protein
MKKIQASGFNLKKVTVLFILVAVVVLGSFIYERRYSVTLRGTVTPDRTWFITAPSLNGLLAYAKEQSGGTQLVTAELDHPTTYVLIGTVAEPIPGDNAIPTGWNVSRAMITPDLAGVQQAANQHMAAFFDLETPTQPGDMPCGNTNNFPFPPVTQDTCAQAHPAETFAQARKIMGSKGMLFAVPGENLAPVLDSAHYNEGMNRFAGMIKLNVASMVAPYVNGYVIQAQQLAVQVHAPYTYNAFVSAVAQQAKSRNASVKVYGVLRSDGGNGTFASADQLKNAVDATANTLNGFWLGIAVLPYPWISPLSSQPGAQPNYAAPYQLLSSLNQVK